MANNLFFSRDTNVYLIVGNKKYTIPVLDGFSFSQATNTSEITLNEMSNSDNVSRRGRQVFTDSFAPAEWSFSTYARPSKNTGGSAGGRAGNSHYAPEDILWAMMAGDAGQGGATTGVLTGTFSGGQISGPTALGDGTYGDNQLLAVETDGGGEGAVVEIGISDVGGLWSASISGDAYGGQGYDSGDKLFVSKEELKSAFGLAALPSNDLTLTIQAGNVTTGNQNIEGYTSTATYAEIEFSDSNKTQLATGDLYFELGSSNTATKTYMIKDAVVNEANLEFDIDGITTINWSGMGSLIEMQSNGVPSGGTDVTLGTDGDDTSNFIRNRLTQLTAVGGPESRTYSLTLTGGSVTVSNNMTFLTPESLGVVNHPIGHVTGTRSVSGSFTCYLSSGSNESHQLFQDLIEDTNGINNSFQLQFDVGGSTAFPRMEVSLPNSQLEVPTHSIEDVISLETNFNSLPSEISEADEVTIVYRGS